MVANHTLRAKVFRLFYSCSSLFFPTKFFKMECFQNFKRKIFSETKLIDQIISTGGNVAGRV